MWELGSRWLPGELVARAASLRAGRRREMGKIPSGVPISEPLCKVSSIFIGSRVKE